MRRPTLATQASRWCSVGLAGLHADPGRRHARRVRRAPCSSTASRDEPRPPPVPPRASSRPSSSRSRSRSLRSSRPSRAVRGSSAGSASGPGTFDEFHLRRGAVLVRVPRGRARPLRRRRPRRRDRDRGRRARAVEACRRAASALRRRRRSRRSSRCCSSIALRQRVVRRRRDREPQRALRLPRRPAAPSSGSRSGSSEGLPRPRPGRALVALALACVLPVLLPIDRLDYNAGLQALALEPWERRSRGSPVGTSRSSSVLLHVRLRRRSGSLSGRAPRPGSCGRSLGIVAGRARVLRGRVEPRLGLERTAASFEGRAATWVDDAVTPGADVVGRSGTRTARAARAAGLLSTSG